MSSSKDLSFVHRKKEEQKGKPLSYRHTFKEWPFPFVDIDGNIDALFVFGHSTEEARLANFPTEEYGPGNISDVTRTIDLSAFFGAHAAERKKAVPVVYPTGILDIHLVKDVKKSRNLISVGGGDVNSLTAEIQQMYGERLPISFLHPTSKDYLISRISRRRFSYKAEGRYVGMLVLVPNPYNEEKVVLLVAGTEAIGTQAGLIALAKGKDRLGQALRDNNKYDPTVPARLVKAVLEHEFMVTAEQRYVGVETITNFEFIE